MIKRSKLLHSMRQLRQKLISQYALLRRNHKAAARVQTRLQGVTTLILQLETRNNS